MQPRKVALTAYDGRSGLLYQGSVTHRALPRIGWQVAPDFTFEIGTIESIADIEDDGDILLVVRFTQDRWQYWRWSHLLNLSMPEEMSN